MGQKSPPVAGFFASGQELLLGFFFLLSLFLGFLFGFLLSLFLFFLFGFGFGLGRSSGGCGSSSRCLGERSGCEQASDQGGENFAHLDVLLMNVVWKRPPEEFPADTCLTPKFFGRLTGIAANPDSF